MAKSKSELQLTIYTSQHNEELIMHMAVDIFASWDENEIVTIEDAVDLAERLFLEVKKRSLHANE